MSFILTEEQESIRKTARDFVKERLPLAHLRQLRDESDAAGFSREVWQELGELGLIGVGLPEEVGGSGLGFAELGLVVEELGRSLAPTPMLASVVLGAGLLARGGTSAQQGAALPGVCDGTRLLALAHEERRSYAPHDISARAERGPEGFTLSGQKCFVLDGHVADSFIVVARSSGETTSRDGLSLFLVPADTAGLDVQRLSVVDSRNVARLQLEGVKVGEDALVGELDKGADLLDPVLDAAAIVLSAEMLGGALQAFEITLAYLKERKQFGVPIGSFQALKHRAANLFCELELSKSVVMDGLRALDDRERNDQPIAASAAKARLSDAFLEVAAEAIQMHGGIGMTDEHDIGFYYKRARSAELQLGSSVYHRDRFARLSGY